MDFDIAGKTIIKVLVKPFEFNSTNLEYILLYFQDIILQIRVDEDLDELLFDFVTDDLNLKQLSVPTWSKELIGKEIITFWNAKNHLGYNDLFAIAINEFSPELIITSIASQLEVRWIH